MKLKPGKIFVKTMPFVWMKLLLGLLTIVVSVVIFAILMGIAYLFKSGGAAIIMFIIWLSATGAVNFLLNRYVGYLVKAGHVAVITEAVTTGKIPDHQLAYGKAMVKERFLTSNIYFVVDMLVSRAVSQIQRGFQKLANKVSFVPGTNTVANVGKMFIGIALGYIDECCLGYTFLKMKQNAFKSAADGVVIYAQNWKKLLKDAAITTLLVILFIIVITVVALLLFFAIFRLSKWYNSEYSRLIGFIAFVLALFFASAVKKALIDSYILVRMMSSYMEVAPSTKITFDLYSKLCNLSTKFKELFNKGQNEGSSTTGARKQVKAKKSTAAVKRKSTRAVKRK